MYLKKKSLFLAINMEEKLFLMCSCLDYFGREFLGVMAKASKNVCFHVTHLLLQQTWKFWLFSLISLDHEQCRNCQVPLIPSANNIELSALQKEMSDKWSQGNPVTRILWALED